MKARKRRLPNCQSVLVRLLGGVSLALFAVAFWADAQAPVALSLQLSNGQPNLSVTGEAGRFCIIQSATDLSRNWQYLTNFTLGSNSSLLLVPNPGVGQRFYRIFAQQVPTNVVVTNMIWISPGTFIMGSPDDEAERYPTEGPQTQVTISRGFWLGKYEVTQADYLAVMGNNPSSFTGDLRRPVEQVSWNDATAYCAALTQREREAGRIPAGYSYRLPTEAEWEFSCRAGTRTAFHYGPALLSGMENFNGTQEYDAVAGSTYNPNGTWLVQTTPVGTSPPNPWGVHEMHGNVHEWCQDWFGGIYPGGAVTDPTGPSTGTDRVIRGGCWFHNAWFCRAAGRYSLDPDHTSSIIGFRVALSQNQP